MWNAPFQSTARPPLAPGMFSVSSSPAFVFASRPIEVTKAPHRLICVILFKHVSVHSLNAASVSKLNSWYHQSLSAAFSFAQIAAQWMPPCTQTKSVWTRFPFCSLRWKGLQPRGVIRNLILHTGLLHWLFLCFLKLCFIVFIYFFIAFELTADFLQRFPLLLPRSSQKGLGVFALLGWNSEPLDLSSALDSTNTVASQRNSANKNYKVIDTAWSLTSLVKCYLTKCPDRIHSHKSLLLTPDCQDLIGCRLTREVAGSIPIYVTFQSASEQDAEPQIAHTAPAAHHAGPKII